MSIKAFSWSKEQTVGSLARKAVFMLLADQARDCGHVWLGITTLAGYCDVDPRNVREHIKNLVIKDEVMTKIEWFRKDGTQTSNLYHLPIDSPRECDKECRGFGSDFGGDEIDTGKHQGDREENNSPTVMNPSGQRPINMTHDLKGNTWAAEPGYEWATQLEELKHVHKTHPDSKWLDKRAAGRNPRWLSDQVELFVDYYNAPGTSLVAWKTAFTGWLNRGAKRDPVDAAIDIFSKQDSMTHDPSKKRGECGCGWCHAYLVKTGVVIE